MKKKMLSLLCLLGITFGFLALTGHNTLAQSTDNHIYDVSSTGFECGTTPPTAGIVAMQLDPTGHEIRVNMEKCDGTAFSQDGYIYITVDGDRQSGWYHTYPAGETSTSFYIDPIEDHGIYGRHTYQLEVNSEPMLSGTVDAWDELKNGQTFVDVPLSHGFYDEIQAFYDKGYTSGANGCITNNDPRLYYCPDENVERVHMAIFILKRHHGADFDPSNRIYQNFFIDVDQNTWGWQWIEELYDEGLTTGCEGTTPSVDLKFCPYYDISGSVGLLDRADAAVFLADVEGWDLSMPTTSVFDDVTGDDYWERAAEYMWWRGYTNGTDNTACGSGLTFCGNLEMTRGEVAAMMMKSFECVAIDRRCAALTTTINPSASGSISAAPDCPIVIDNTKFTFNNPASLTAIPATGYTFSSWSGDLSGSQNPSSLSMGDTDKAIDRSVTANFEPICYSLTQNITPLGGGSFNVSPAPNCNATEYLAGTSLTLEAIPNTDYTFQTWQGDVTHTETPTNFTINSNAVITAAFQAVAPCYSLVTSVYPSSSGTANPGGGSISVSPAPDCEGNKYTADTTITLTAIPTQDYIFYNWQGGPSDNTNPASLIMNADRDILATFIPTINVVVSNVGTDTFTISWITDIATESKIEYGTLSDTLDQFKEDNQLSHIHVITLTGLTPDKNYYFNVISGLYTYDDDGQPYQQRTAPLLSSPTADATHGLVYKSDRSTPAGGCLVYITLQDADGNPTLGQATILSEYTDGDGSWESDFAQARTTDLTDYFSYQAGDHALLNVECGSEGTASRTVVIEAAIPGIKRPFPDICLNQPYGLCPYTAYVPLIIK